METLNLPKPVIFLEFFVRNVTFCGGDKAKSMPPKILHYTGKCLSKPKNEDEPKIMMTKIPPLVKCFGFKDGKPVVRKGYEKRINITDKTKGYCLVAREYYDMATKKWVRGLDQINRVLNFNLPHYFKIKSVDSDGNAITDFPRGETPLKKGKVYAYICYSREYHILGTDQGYPNKYLVLFVKNYGYHDKIGILSDRDFKVIDSSNLCDAKDISIRDYRKSRFTFSF